MSLQLTAPFEAKVISLATGAVVKILDVRISTRQQVIQIDYQVFASLADLNNGKDPVDSGAFTPSTAQITTITNTILTRAYAAIQANRFPSSIDLGLP